MLSLLILTSHISVNQVRPKYPSVPTALLPLVSLHRYHPPSVLHRVSCSYIVHSAFAFTFPLHILSLLLTEQISVESVLEGLSLAIKIHFAPSELSHHTILRSPFPRFRFLLLIALLTLGVTVPALLWFISVSLSP